MAVAAECHRFTYSYPTDRPVEVGGEIARRASNISTYLDESISIGMELAYDEWRVHVCFHVYTSDSLSRRGVKSVLNTALLAARVFALSIPA